MPLPFSFFTIALTTCSHHRRVPTTSKANSLSFVPSTIISSSVRIMLKHNTKLRAWNRKLQGFAGIPPFLSRASWRMVFTAALHLSIRSVWSPMFKYFFTIRIGGWWLLAGVWLQVAWPSFDGRMWWDYREYSCAWFEFLFRLRFRGSVLNIGEDSIA